MQPSRGLLVSGISSSLTASFVWLLVLFSCSFIQISHHSNNNILVSAGSCSCTPPDDPCNFPCASCGTTSKLCDCWTGCSLGGCPGGYNQIDSTWCFIANDEDCQHSVTVRSSICASCYPYRYGSACAACPGIGYDSGGNANGACNYHGTCSAGINGNGVCTCSSLDYNGNACQFSRAGTCNNRGQPNYSGTGCTCDYSYGGTFCGQCAANFYGQWPTCNFCTPSGKCNSHGSCDTSNGNCICTFNSGISAWGGTLCNACYYTPPTTYYYNYPSCIYCDNSTTCNTHGYCQGSGSGIGTCKCYGQNTGANCNICPTGYATNYCTPCPGGASNPCNGLGTCSQGYTGTGVCTCSQSFRGTACIDAVILGVVPATADTSGGTSVRIDGAFFGTVTGTVRFDPFSSNIPFDVASWTDSRIFVTTRQGLVASSFLLVTRGSDGVQSQTSGSSFSLAAFGYNPPVILSLNPAIVSTAGVAAMTITGTSFGAYTAGVSFIILCTPANSCSNMAGTTWTHNKIVTPIPAGGGTGYNIKIKTGGNQVSSAVFYSYAPPTFTSIYPPSMPPTGGLNITIDGADFGAAQPGVLVGTDVCTVLWWSSSRIICLAPPGRGDLDVFVTVSGQTGQFPYNYDAAVITNVTGCAGTDGWGTRFCQTSGGELVNITGYNFGNAIPESGHNLVITIGGRVCSNPTMINPNLLRCTTPQGAGLYNPVCVVAKDIVGCANLLSYASPQLTSRSLRLVGQSAVYDPTNTFSLVKTSNTTTRYVQMDGVFFGSNFSAVSVKYGPPENPYIYSCQLRVATDLLPGGAGVKCWTTQGVGGGLVFVVIVSGVQSNIGIDQYWYGAPNITSGTISIGTGPGASSVTSATTLGDVIQFKGLNFGPNVNPYLVVTYGPNTSATAYGCSIQSGQVDNLIVCKTDRQDSCTGSKCGSGLGNVFRVAAGLGSSAQIVQGTDIYNYPTAPVVQTVAGCTPSGFATVDCPTDAKIAGAQVVLTITGQFFGPSGAVVSVGNQQCTRVVHLSSSAVTCELPVGTGINQPVVLSQGTLYSRQAFLLSYAFPAVTSVRGCNVTLGNNTRSCDRYGGTLITLTGSNFGPANAKVLLDGARCTGVVHVQPNVHRVITCYTGPGTTPSADVLVQQDKGQISAATVTVGYAQCAAGQYAAVNTIPCSFCNPGTFSSSTDQTQTSCLACSPGTFAQGYGNSICHPCDAGYFSANDSTVQCQTCDQGRYSAFPGSTQCHDCDPGNFLASSGKSICQQCNPGQYQDVSGQTFCHDCAPGSAMVQAGQSTCTLCDPGFNATLSGSSVCLPCPQGWHSSNGQLGKGSLTCTLCAPGKYASGVGRDVCTDCELGFFNPGIGAANCLSCDPGKYSDQPGSINCTLCAAGSATLVSASPSCSACAPGTYSDSSGFLTCIPCNPGSFQALQGMTYCDNCTFGSSQNLFGQPSCVSCAPGLYSNTISALDCSACPPGTHSENGTIPGATGCTACEPGKFNGVLGRPVCTDCPSGTFMSDYSAQTCKSCAMGYAAFLQGSVECTPCTIGYAAPVTGSVTCDACSPGSYSNTNASIGCLDCEPGRYAANEGSTVCSLCDPGTAAFSNGNIQCSQCEDGKYSNSSGNELCTNCEPGRSVRQINRLGQTSCIDCGIGSHANADGFSACTPCEKGKYANTNGSINCMDCPEGTYADTFAQTVCGDCPIGKSQPISGQPECNDCNPGRYQDTEGRSNCTACEPGKAIIGFGSTFCEPCSNGTFMNVEGQADCQLCPQGRFSNTTGLVNCLPCPPGLYQDLLGALDCQECQPGRSQVLDGQSKCIDCVEGTYTNFTGQSACARCPAGEFQDVIGQLDCRPCTSGHAASDDGSPSCPQCRAGKFTNFTKQTNCTDCVPGRYQNIPGSNDCVDTPAGFYTTVGSDQPIPCPTRKVAPFPRSDDCVPCPVLAENNKESTACLCVAGFYSFDTLSVNATNFECLPCPQGADCEVSGVTWATLGSLPGWWRANTDTLQFYRCLLPFHCDGGRNSSCGNNREGPLCAICQSGYKSTTSTSSCTKCPAEGLAFFTTIIIIVLVAAAMVVMYYIILRSNRDLMEADKERDRRIMEWDQSVYYMDDDAKMKSNAPVLSAESRSRPNFTYKMKIILGFLQISTILMTVVVVKWPSAFLDFMNFFSFINFDFVPWQSLGCVSRFNFYTKMVVITLSPIVTLLLLILFFLIPSYYLDGRDMGDDDTYRAARKRTRRKFWKLVLFTMFLLYPGVSSIIMSFYQCINIEDVDYLIKDFTVICYDDKWYQLLGFNVAMLVLYPVGVPAFVLYKLTKYKYRLAEPGVRIQLGFLYEAYHNDFWWFELVDLLHKLTLTSLLPFLPADAVMPFAMVIIVLYMLFILLCKPYIRKGDDRLHLFVQNVLFLFCCCGYVIYYVDKYARQSGTGSEQFTMDDSIDKLMSAVLIIIAVSLLLLFLVMSVRNAKKIIRNLQRKQQEKALAKEDQNEGGVDHRTNRQGTGFIGTGGTGTGTNSDMRAGGGDGSSGGTGGGGTDDAMELRSMGTTSQISNASQSSSQSHPLAVKPVRDVDQSSAASAGVVVEDDDMMATTLPKMSERPPAQCDECDDPSKPITRKCVDCQQWLCVDCSAKLHDRGKRKLHKVDIVSVQKPSSQPESHFDGASIVAPTHQKCDECDGSNGPVSMRCLECKQWLCDKCNTKLHSKGKRAAHKVVNVEASP